MALPKMVAVESSMLAAMGYDAAAQQAYIRFKNGKVYRVNDLPAATYRDWMASPSVGTYFNREIKNGFVVEEYVL